MQCSAAATRKTLAVDLRERFANGAGAWGSYQPSRFLAVAQEHERRPQFHAERASEAPAARIGDLDVAHRGMRSESVGDERLGAPAPAAPGTAELEQRRPLEGVDFLACRLACRVPLSQLTRRGAARSAAAPPARSFQNFACPVVPWPGGLAARRDQQHARPFFTRLISRSSTPSSGGLRSSSAELIASTDGLDALQARRGVVVARGFPLVAGGRWRRRGTARSGAG